jgi:hypothetical protein
MNSPAVSTSLAQRPGTAPQDHLRAKLSEIGSTFEGLEREIEQGTHLRSRRLESSVAAVAGELNRLEGSLTAEIQRRVDANKVLQEITEQVANAMLDRVQTKVMKRIEQVATSVVSLEVRAERLEREIAGFEREIPVELQASASSCVRSIRDLAVEAEADRLARIERDTEILRRTCEVEVNADGRYNEEVRAAEQLTSALQGEIRRAATVDATADEFRSFITQELAALKSGLAVATEQRKTTDDEVVTAIHHFTTSLHKGLRMTVAG